MCVQDQTLDGELFLGRKKFNETSSIVRTQNFQDARWRTLKFMVFDIPSLGQKPFEERLQFLQATFDGCGNTEGASPCCSYCRRRRRRRRRPPVV